MSKLDRRVQLLLEPSQYEQLEREAARAGGSVASVIRDAIDARLAAGQDVRAAAADRLLRSAESDDVPGEDWDAVKAGLEAALAGKIS
ncbi:hypothetical protein SAMN05444157_0672 [Frankineae bacterium MT45]|nr:hypothetical protein SAMN05444157_0672 [Frankineae bacterium MT45]